MRMDQPDIVSPGKSEQIKEMPEIEPRFHREFMNPVMPAGAMHLEIFGFQACNEDIVSETVKSTGQQILNAFSS